MPEDGQGLSQSQPRATQPQAARERPRDPTALREQLGIGFASATETNHASCRVAPAQATNDGNFATSPEQQVGTRQPHPSNDGISARTPPIRERRAPIDSARAPAPPAPVGRTGFPRTPARQGQTPERNAGRQTGLAGTTTDARASDPRGQAPASDGRMPEGDADRTSYFSGEEFVRPDDIGDDADRAPGREGQEGDYAEPDGTDFDAIPEQGHDGTSGRTSIGGPDAVSARDGAGAAQRNVAMAPQATGAIPPPSGSISLSGQPVQNRQASATGTPASVGLAGRDDTPISTPVQNAERTQDPGGPAGPDFDRKRTVTQAMESALDQRREKRRQKNGDDAPAAGGQVGSEAGRMSTLLQNSETHAGYLARGQQLLNRYKRENGVQLADEDVDLREFVYWMLGLRPLLSQSSWRVYRIGAAALIQTIPNDAMDEALNVLAGQGRQIEEEARVVYRQTRDKAGSDTSAVRAKRMELAHFRKLRANLRLISRSSKVDWLDDWLVAGITTGLSPGEWPLAALEIRRDGRARRAWLHVVNAKATNGRGNGSHRTLDVSSYTDETLEAIGRMVRRSEQWAIEGSTQRRQSDVAQLFYTVCKKLFPRMQTKYSLYSLRHQFIANIKAVYADSAIVAALIGRISVETQVEYYGKKRSSWGLQDIREIPRAMDDQVAQVRKYLTMLEERAHLKLMRKAFAEGRDMDEDSYAQDDEIELAQDFGPEDDGPDGSAPVET